MTGEPPEQGEQRRAQVRAQAAIIADSSRSQRHLAVPPGVSLRGSARKRWHSRRGLDAPPPPPPPARRTSWARRGVAIAALLIQASLLVLALTLPAFQVHRVTVTGTRLLSPGSVVAAAAVPEQSIFTVDGAAIQARVLALPWVQSATVTTDLPATVRVAIVERAPVLRVRRDGVDTLVADDGATLPDAAAPSSWASIPVLVDDRVGSPQVMQPRLAQTLGAIATRFPAVFGCPVAGYVWGADDVVSLWAGTGWRAVLGHLDTADGLAALPAQLQTLAALRGRLDYSTPSFGYVDVESPSAPATGGAPGLPAEVTAAALPAGAPAPPQDSVDGGVVVVTPAPTPSPSATPVPTATPAPTPQPVIIGGTPTPSPAAHG